LINLVFVINERGCPLKGSLLFFCGSDYLFNHKVQKEEHKEEPKEKKLWRTITIN